MSAARLLPLVALLACTPDDAPADGPPYAPHTDLDLRGADGQPADVADPCVIRVDDTWYLYGTHSFVDLEVWSSTDLATWTYGGVIWEPTPGSWNDHPSIWAPHVEVTDHGAFLYYSANGRVGVATGDGPLGPFTDASPEPLVGGGHGGIGDGVYVSDPYDVEDADEFLADAEEYAIDAFLLRQADGALSLWFARLLPWSAIGVVRMTDELTVAPEPPAVALTLDPDAAWESLNREGPWVIEQDGRLILTYSGNYWWTPEYAIGAATGDGPFEAFTRQGDGPILASDPAIGAVGPGHHSIAPGARDDLLMFYHNKVSEAAYSPRRTRYAPVTINPEGLVTVQGATTTP